MYHLRLVKALSYTGYGLSATKKKPDVFTEDGNIAEALVDTGYFQLIEGNGELHSLERQSDNGENEGDFIPGGIVQDGENGADNPNPNNTMPGNGDNAGNNIPDGIVPIGEGEGKADNPAPTDEQPKGKTLDEMSRAELETFATYKNVAVKGLSKKADIVAKLREVLGPEETSGIIEYGSPTMAELQQQ